MSYCVGLTGGIGSGKSTVATLFSDLGVPVIDTDSISHQLTQPGGRAIPAIRNAFGDDFIDTTGALDRVKMRKLVFGDSAAKHKLEQLLHPLILAKARTLAESSTAPYVVLVVPLLFETGNYCDWIQHTVTVDCAEESQIARAAGRENMNAQAVRSIMAQQLPRAQRLNLADDLIHNDGTLTELREQVARLHQRYLTLSSRRI